MTDVPMPDKAKLGRRYACFQCAQKFYDLNRPEPLCPKCGADQRENPSPDPREAILARFKSKTAPKSLRIEEEEAAEAEEEEEIEIEDEDADDDEEEEPEREAEEE